ncbi:MAG: O-antigen ligase family protein [Chitinophagaceae bacterium]|nr:O-antigen ligase family protein [Chitinophagaceae bacterium]MBL0306729.1 O-antigen ligase family protein [Chitinophagaceae bacterium]
MASFLFGGLFWIFCRYKYYISRKYFFSLLLALIVLQLYFQSRTAILASLTTTAYVLYPYIVSKLKKKIYTRWTFVLLFLSVVFLTVLVKTDSSIGRWFIWKQAFKLWKENWLAGVGIGKFNPEINHLQAAYFSNTSLYTKEAMLANDCYFAFNELLHFSIEFGFVGLLCSVFITYFVLKACFANINSHKGWAGAILIPVFVGCLFSYPLHNIFISIGSIFLIGYLVSDYSIFKIRWFRRFIIFFTVLLCTGLSISIYNHFMDKKNFSCIKQFVKDGHRTKAFQLAYEVSDKFKKDPQFTIFYLDLLYDTRRLDLAVNWFNKFHKYHCNQIAHSLIAKCHDELEDYGNAEMHYLMSLYLTPHLLQSRLDLMNFYRRYNNTERAKYWATEALNYPAKVHNNRVELIREKAKIYLLSLEKEEF